MSGCGAFPDFTENQITKMWPQYKAMLYCASTGVETDLSCVNGSWNKALPVCYNCKYNILPVCYYCTYDTLPAY